MGRSTQLLKGQFDTLYTQYRHIEYMHERVWFTINIIDKMTAIRQFFRIVLKRGYSCSIIVHTWAVQLLSHILVDHFDTLPTQCRHIEHTHEGVWFPKILLTELLTKLQL